MQNLKACTGSWFKSLLVLLSGVLILFFCLVFGGLVLWPDPQSLVSALTSEEILFSIQLSLFTAVTSTLLCATVALPVAYALSRAYISAKGFMGLVISLPLSPSPVAGIALLIFLASLRRCARAYRSRHCLYHHRDNRRPVLCQCPYLIRVCVLILFIPA